MIGKFDRQRLCIVAFDNNGFARFVERLVSRHWRYCDRLTCLESSLFTVDQDAQRASLYGKGFGEMLMSMLGRAGRKRGDFESCVNPTVFHAKDRLVKALEFAAKFIARAKVIGEIDLRRSAKDTVQNNAENKIGDDEAE